MSSLLMLTLHEVKKILWCFLLLQMLIITQTASVNTSSDTLVKVEPYASTVHVGETFTINATITDVENLYGIEIILRWDTSVLQIVNVDVRLGIEDNADGILHTPIYPYINETNEEEGKYTLAASSGAPAPSFSGGGNIFKITFNVTRARTSKLDIEKSELAGKPPNPSATAPRIVHSTIDGFFYPIHILASPTMIDIGESVNISGFIATAQANIQMVFQYRREGETDWHTLTTVKTSDQGNYLYVWQPQEGGKYEIKTTATIEGVKETSRSVFVTVKAPEQPTWIYITIITAVVVVAAVTATAIYRRRAKKS